MLTSFLIGLSVFLWLIEKKLKDSFIINRIFKGDSEIGKLLVVISEALLLFGYIVIIVMLVANVYLSIPMQRPKIDNRIILYSSSERFLIAEYSMLNKSRGNEIKIDFETLQIVEIKDLVFATTERARFSMRNN